MRLWYKTAPPLLLGAALFSGGCLVAGIPAGAGRIKRGGVTQQVTYLPYIMPGDQSGFGASDQMLVAWQTNETTPGGAYTVTFKPVGSNNPPTTAFITGRVVDNYLAADSQFTPFLTPGNPSFISTLYGAHVNYVAVLPGLIYNTQYTYTVSGPGLPYDPSANSTNFTSTFHTRKTGTQFSFEVQGDEGYYPNQNKGDNLLTNYEARIIHLMYNVQNLSFANQPQLPAPDFALNTGDNVYIAGSDSTYRDFWFQDWNNAADSNETGAPFIRHIPLYIVNGNHDVGGNGATANLLADPLLTPNAGNNNMTQGTGAAGRGAFQGGVGGGDALAYFNNYYYALNGPSGVDIQNRFNGDGSTATNFFFTYNGANYTSQPAIDALRNSTNVNTGQGNKNQIDYMSNYSFDYGNAHFVFLDANPHVFNNLLPGGPPASPPSFPFPAYPSVLRNWLINDLDSSSQTWKIVVYHQPAFSSGNATVSNDQMRRIAKFLEDHGVNMVFNGHEHNYQRSLPIRSLSGVTQSPTKSTPPVVAVDANFDGVTHTVPNGVLYFVEGAGGNKDFDDALPSPRGGGVGIDQDDAAAGTYSSGGNTFVNGPASWLDTNLTTDAMKAFVNGAGTGQKITAKFKSKVFSFADIVVNDNVLTLFQITEPLLTTSSATPSSPAPYGTDLNGSPLNDPIPDTIFDPATHLVTSPAATGTPALLDKITVTKPVVNGQLTAFLSAPPVAAPNGALVYTVKVTNAAPYYLNGVQAVVTLDSGTMFADTLSNNLTLQGQNAVITIAGMPSGTTAIVQVKTHVTAPGGSLLHATATVRSSTALPVATNTTVTRVAVRATPPPPHP